ncbi:MAG: RidA family protein [Planctomycetota bacterium]|jgi:reactive intermediate/imine deaminase
MSSHQTNRRGFLLGLPTGIVAATSVNRAQADSGRGKRMVVGKSPYPTFSRAVAYNGIVFVAGVVGQKPGTRELASSEFDGQCRQAMENLKSSVESAGSRMSAVLKCGVFLTDYEDFPRFNEIYVTYFPDQPPARSTVIVKGLVVPGAKLEIDCVTCLE